MKCYLLMQSILVRFYCRKLPVNVQKGLFKYLEQRGITLSATNYMHDYMVTRADPAMSLERLEPLLPLETLWSPS